MARALGRDAEDVESTAQHLARAHLFLNIAGGAEDRGLATRYEFTHALHHQAIYEQIPTLRRQRLHLTIAETLESTAGERVAEIAPELSVHFERGGDPLRAAKSWASVPREPSSAWRRMTSSRVLSSVSNCYNACPLRQSATSVSSSFACFWGVAASHTWL